MATVLDHLVFAEPENREARELLAMTYDQLGYQAESAPWRDVYLTAALELRRGISGTALDISAAAELLRHMPVERFFDSMASRIVGSDAAETDMRLNFTFTDIGRTFALRITNGVLNYREGAADPDADVTLKLTRDLWLRLVVGQAGLRELVFSDELEIDGSRMSLLSFFQLMEMPKGAFNIVTP